MWISMGSDRSMRDFPQAGARHDQGHEMLPGNARPLGSLFDQGWAILTDGENPLVVNDNGLAVVFRVFLHLGSVCGPIEVIRHPLFQFGHPAKCHGVVSKGTSVETFSSYSKVPKEGTRILPSPPVPFNPCGTGPDPKKRRQRVHCRLT